MGQARTGAGTPGAGARALRADLRRRRADLEGARWPFGGDYSGLAAGADGRFHVFWADSRTGTYQVWTAAVRVGG